jgi:hypothetical protein
MGRYSQVAAVEANEDVESPNGDSKSELKTNGHANSGINKRELMARAVSKRLGASLTSPSPTVSVASPVQTVIAMPPSESQTGSAISSASVTKVSADFQNNLQLLKVS